MASVANARDKTRIAHQKQDSPGAKSVPPPPHPSPWIVVSVAECGYENSQNLTKQVDPRFAPRDDLRPRRAGKSAGYIPVTPNN